MLERHRQARHPRPGRVARARPVLDGGGGALGLGLALAAALSAACVPQSRVAEATIRNAGAPLSAPRAVPDRTGELATLGPLTRVRGIDRNGEITPWHEAGDLWVSDAGLLAEPVRLGSLETAEVSGLDDEELRWLDEMRPRDIRAQVTTGFGRTTLHVWRADRLVPWIVSFLARARAGGKPLGSWRLTDRSALGGLAAEPVAGGPLDIDPRALLAAGDQAGDIRAAHGIRWSEGGAFDLEYFDAGKGAFALIPLVPLAIVGALAYAALGGGSFSDDGHAENVGGGPTLVLKPEAVARTTPLFTENARRRAFVTLVAAADAGAALARDARAGVSAAVRFTELLEMGAFARVVSTVGVDPDAARAERLVAGGRLGLHVALGPASPWAVAGGADIGAAVAGPGLRMGGFYSGIRRKLGPHAFAGVYPLVPTWFSGDERVPGARLAWMASLEFGVEM